MTRLLINLNYRETRELFLWLLLKKELKIGVSAIANCDAKV
jgi:hypothetical protein